MFKRLSHNVVSVISLGNCCKSAVDIIPVTSPDITLLVDFSHHARRVGEIENPLLIVRSVPSMAYQTGHRCELLSGGVVRVDIDEESLKTNKMLKIVVSVSCQASTRGKAKLVQHVILKFID